VPAIERGGTTLATLLSRGIGDGSIDRISEEVHVKPRGSSRKAIEETLV
jgi:hypothetical protein